jgi:tRNA(Ile)-lysidine synthase
MPSENFLRDIRYNFFEKIRQEKKFDLIAVAHNLDDQVETFFLRLLRGSGLAGLSGMKIKNGKIMRPLLFTAREEIEKYLKENKLSFRVDRTNLESKYFRNKIRNKLIPYLEKNYNPEIKKTIFDSMQSIIDDYDWLELEARKIRTDKELSVTKLLKLHPALQKRILRQAILNVKSDLKNIESAHIDEILKAARSTKNKPQNVVLKGLKITRRGDKLKIEKEKK